MEGRPTEGPGRQSTPDTGRESMSRKSADFFDFDMLQLIDFGLRPDQMIVVVLDVALAVCGKTRERQAPSSCGQTGMAEFGWV
jgi:hypothetical protein